MAKTVTTKTKVKVPLDLYEFQSRVLEIHRRHTVNYRGCEFWNNSEISDDNTSIPSDTEVMFHLDKASRAGTLEAIQSYPDPLAFESRSESITVRCWDFGRIAFLARDEESVEARDHNEFEVWVRTTTRFEGHMNTIREDINAVS